MKKKLQGYALPLALVIVAIFSIVIANFSSLSKINADVQLMVNKNFTPNYEVNKNNQSITIHNENYSITFQNLQNHSWTLQ
jgi:ABC-type transport system involved in multi-copper enzyme maturation permease subunit